MEKNSVNYEKSILSEQRFKDYFNIRSSKAQAKNSILPKDMVIRYKVKEVRKELERVRCSIEKNATKFAFYLEWKIASHMLSGIFVDQVGLDRVKTLLSESRKNKIVFMPVYKSYADTILMHVINYQQDLELGFTLGNYEDSPKAQFVDRILKQTGHFLLRRKENDKSHPEYSYINQAIMQEVINENAITTIF